MYDRIKVMFMVDGESCIEYIKLKKRLDYIDNCDRAIKIVKNDNPDATDLYAQGINTK